MRIGNRILVIQTIYYIQEGEGETVLLLRSTAARNKQWKKLISEPSLSIKVLALNLFWQGTTPEWKSNQKLKLSDHFDLLNDFFNSTDKLSIVRHSFSVSVEIVAARRFPEKIKKLILIEPNPFYLLAHHSRNKAYQEAKLLYDTIKVNSAYGNQEKAAAFFADYWNGLGAWDSVGQQQKINF